MTEIKNKILKTELVEWKKLKWLQNQNLKEMTTADVKKLKNSIKINGFVQPFNIWQDGKTLWCLDGHHRQKVLEEMIKEDLSIPEKFPANFIQCKNKKEAAKFVLIYSAIYAKVNDEGLYEFLHTEGVNFSDLKLEVELPDINLDEFEGGWMNDNDKNDSGEGDESGITSDQYKGDLKNKLLKGDCLLHMKNIPDKTVDLILCDLPYGTTEYEWDIVIPFEPLWEQYKRVIKDNGAIILTASQPFTTKVVASNYDMFRYELIWEKTRASGMLNSNKIPMKNHENILVFYEQLPTYNPIRRDSENLKRINRIKSKRYVKKPSGIPGYLKSFDYIDDGTRMPVSVVRFKSEGVKGMHPTQKPTALFEYLIKTYTNEGDLVLDNCAGSGTTGVAAINTKRNYILIEKEDKYCEIIKARIKEALSRKSQEI